MSLASFRLESFSAPQTTPRPEPVFLQADIDQAFSDGLAKGAASTADEQLRHLEAGLSRLTEALRADNDRMIAIRRQAVSALAPVLEALLDGLSPAAQSRRLEEALQLELERLAATPAPLRASITCGTRQVGMVRSCIEAMGLEEIDLIESSEDRINLELHGGRIEISATQISRDIKALLAELRDGE